MNNKQKNFVTSRWKLFIKRLNCVDNGAHTIGGRYCRLEGTKKIEMNFFILLKNYI